MTAEHLSRFVNVADPNNILLHDWKVCFMLPCKVGNSSIKGSVCHTLGISKSGMHRDDRWHYADKHEIAALGDDWYTIGFIRNPYNRFMSAWRHKIRDENIWRRLGFNKKPDPLTVAQRLPEITDQHWRPLVDELLIDDRIVPDLLIRTDRLDKSWKYVRNAVSSHCGVEMADIPHLNRTAPSAPLRGDAKDLVRDWYRRDFEVFGYQV